MTKIDTLLRGYGLREIAVGTGLLLTRNPRPWLWGRVAGDILDVATVAGTANANKSARLVGSFVALLGVGLLDLYTAIQSKPKRSGPARNYPISESRALIIACTRTDALAGACSLN